MSQNRRILFTADARFAVTKPSGTTGPVTLTGYALVWNVPSSDRGGYSVRLLPNSAKFTDSVHALRDHDFGKVLGNTANGTLRIKPDNYGVKVEIDLPNTTLGRDTATEIEDKYVAGMSFSMSSEPTGRFLKEGGVNVFEASAFEVDEVSVVANPAFSQTAIGMTPDASDFNAARQQAARFQELQFSALRLSR